MAHPIGVKKAMFYTLKLMKEEINKILTTVEGVPADHYNLFYYWFPSRFNGFTRTRKSKNGKYIIGVNLYRDAFSTEMSLFYLCATLFHEIEHIRLMENIESSCTTTNQWLIQAEQSSAVQGFEHIIDRFSVVSIKNRKHSRNKRYQTSSTELQCVYYGYVNALKYMEDRLSIEDQKTIQLICESLAFVLRHLEIEYTLRNIPVCKFLYRFNILEKMQKSKKSLPDAYLSLFFHDNWKRRTLAEVFSQQDRANTELIDSLMFYIFLFSDLDFTQDFEGTPELRYYMESLVDKYIRKLR